MLIIPWVYKLYCFLIYAFSVLRTLLRVANDQRSVGEARHRLIHQLSESWQSSQKKNTGHSLQCIHLNCMPHFKFSWFQANTGSGTLKLSVLETLTAGWIRSWLSSYVFKLNLQMFLSPLSSSKNPPPEWSWVLLSKQTALLVLQVADPFAKTPVCFLSHLRHFPPGSAEHEHTQHQPPLPDTSGLLGSTARQDIAVSINLNTPCVLTNLHTEPI